MQSSQRRRAAAGSTGEPVGQRLFHLAPKLRDQFGRGQRAGERGALPGPLRPVPELSRCFRGFRLHAA